jgi:hypothetical protein
MILDEDHKDDVDEELRPVLKDQSIDAHEPTKSHVRILTQIEVIIDRKAVKHRRSQHILANKSDHAISLNARERMVLLFSLAFEGNA